MTSLPEQVALDPSLAEQIDRYDRALETRDLRSLEELIAGDFILVSPAAIRKARADWFNWFDSIVQYDEMRREIFSVRVFADATVVLSECTPLMRLRGGEPSVHRALMLDVWTNRDGPWQLAVTQYTRGPQG